MMRCDTCLNKVHTKGQQTMASPITPPAETSPVSMISTALLMLRSQARAITHLTDIYSADQFTQDNYTKSIQLMHNSLVSGGKIVISGMGKSGKIAEKLVATMNSLGLHAVNLHPCDALHGDLGVLRPTDVLVMITASGKTPELLNLLPHVPSGLARICLTCTPDSILGRGATAVLSAHLPGNLDEKAIYGVPAPTTSTTACLAVGDAVCITLAEIITAEKEERKRRFGKSHPGGAIGADYDDAVATTVRDVMLPWAEVGVVDADADELEILRAAAGRRWVCVGNERLYKGHELVQPNVRGLRLESLRRVGSKDDIKTIQKGEVVIVMKDMNRFAGIYEGN
ncbi:hypothetical protein V1512DRAFT_265593 [Lipomyces arxii]|uniref:uncharacterized protein n=1 Tax=Lipomyces arxii TaxID=56418 RepID=UPI0034CF0730